MTACGVCPDPYACRDAGWCQAEAWENAERDEHYREQEAEHYREQERLHWIEREGNCASHAQHDPTCEDCLAWCSLVGLRA